MPCPSIGPNCYGRVQIGFDRMSKIYFGPHQLQLFSTEFHILIHVQNVWSCSKQFECVQNSFGLIERQGMSPISDRLDYYFLILTFGMRPKAGLFHSRS